MPDRCLFEQETGSEKQKDDTITACVPGADALCARVQWNGYPINESENGREQSGRNSTNRVPVGNLREDSYAGEIKCDIGNPGGDEQAQRQHNHHLVNWMAEEFGFRFHL